MNFGAFSMNCRVHCRVFRLCRMVDTWSNGTEESVFALACFPVGAMGAGERVSSLRCAMVKSVDEIVIVCCTCEGTEVDKDYPGGCFLSSTIWVAATFKSRF